MAPAPEAEAALRRLLDDRDGTPAVERGRAAVHLAALRLRAGDRTGADAALDAAGLEAPARAWAARAATVAADHRGPYRAVSGAPAPLSERERRRSRRALAGTAPSAPARRPRRRSRRA